jgi:hypothetical protein
MAVVVWIVFGWRDRPRRMWLLPGVFLFWVNTQGLFALGFVILAMGIADASLRPSMWRRDRREWWGLLIAACGLSVIACLINPYGLRGLLFPLSLAGTMGNPVFRTIGELTPIPQFIRSLGIPEFPAELTLGNLPNAVRVSIVEFPAFPLPLKLHLGAMALGCVSFAFPILGGLAAYSRRAANEPSASKESSASKSAKGRKGGKGSTAGVSSAVDEATGPFAGFSLFRLLMWTFFSLLSLQATRNSHQFAAAMGFVTAANLAEGASLFSRSRRPGKAADASDAASVSPGAAVALAFVGLVLVWVGTGQFYQDAGEGRVIGWGEEPLWFPHEAVKAAGADGLPDKFASFHNGHAALYDYYFGPEKKVFSDARLEVIGPVLYQKQNQLSTALNRNEPIWRSLVNGIGRPVILADHAANSGVSVTLLAANDYACTHFDPVAAVFAPTESLQGTSIRPFDFLAAHYDPNGFRAYDEPTRLALTRALRNIAGGLSANGRDDLARPLNLAGVGLASAMAHAQNDSAERWKLLGQLLQTAAATLQLEVPPTTIDPVADLTLLRCMRALRRAANESGNGDFSTLYSLAMLQRGLAQSDQELSTLERLVRLTPINTTQSTELENARTRIAELQRKLSSSSSPTSTAGKPSDNGFARAEIEREVDRLIAAGRVLAAAETLETVLPRFGAPLELVEKLGAIRLWLGDRESAEKAYARLEDQRKRELMAALGLILDADLNGAVDRLSVVEKLANDRSEDDAYRFVIAALKAQILAETGDAAGARKAADEAGNQADTPGRRDIAERLHRLIPK